MNKRADMDSETRDLDESLEMEELVQDKVISYTVLLILMLQRLFILVPSQARN